MYEIRHFSFVIVKNSALMYEQNLFYALTSVSELMSKGNSKKIVCSSFCQQPASLMGVYHNLPKVSSTTFVVVFFLPNAPRVRDSQYSFCQ